MNNQFLGSSYCLMNYDLTIQLCKAFSLPLWYVPMLTASRAKNRYASQMENYRLGSQHPKLLAAMKDMYSKQDTDVTEVSEYLRNEGIDVKTITSEENRKAGYYTIGNNPYFIHKERGHYFEGLSNLIANSGQQIIFIDPDTGIAPPNLEVSRTKGSSLLLLSEIRIVLNKVTDDSIILVHQSMNNNFYNQEARIKDLYKELQTNIILLVDEVIQSGLFIITKSEGMNKAILNRLQYYLAGYKGLKAGNRVLLGYNEGEEAIVKSISSFEIDN